MFKWIKEETHPSLVTLCTGALNTEHSLQQRRAAQAQGHPSINKQQCCKWFITHKWACRQHSVWRNPHDKQPQSVCRECALNMNNISVAFLLNFITGCDIFYVFVLCAHETCWLGSAGDWSPASFSTEQGWLCHSVPQAGLKTAMEKHSYTAVICLDWKAQLHTWNKLQLFFIVRSYQSAAPWRGFLCMKAWAGNMEKPCITCCSQHGTLSLLSLAIRLLCWAVIWSCLAGIIHYTSPSQAGWLHEPSERRLLRTASLWSPALTPHC